VRNELLEIAEEDELVDQVVQVNLQLFPLSQKVQHKENTP
jgi:hypothetical protein